MQELQVPFLDGHDLQQSVFEAVHSPLKPMRINSFGAGEPDRADN